MISSIDWQDLLVTIIMNPDNWVIFASLVILSSIWHWIRKRRQVFQLFTGENGSVTVSRNALNNLIRQMVQHLAPRSAPKVYLRTSSNQLAVDIRIKLYSNRNVPELSSQLRKNISKMLKENLGIDKISNINITVTGFSDDPEEHVQD